MHAESLLEYVRGVGTHQRAGEHVMGTFHNTSYIYVLYELRTAMNNSHANHSLKIVAIVQLTRP